MAAAEFFRLMSEAMQIAMVCALQHRIIKALRVLQLLEEQAARRVAERLAIAEPHCWAALSSEQQVPNLEWVQAVEGTLEAAQALLTLALLQALERERVEAAVAAAA